MREDSSFHMDIVSEPMVRWACPTKEEVDDEDDDNDGVVVPPPTTPG